jgi:hypothetical protein
LRLHLRLTLFLKASVASLLKSKGDPADPCPEAVKGPGRSLVRIFGWHFRAMELLRLSRLTRGLKLSQYIKPTKVK